MDATGFKIDFMPELKDPLFIAGFDGWGNALNISKTMLSFMIRQHKAECFAVIESDRFYRFDDNRPIVRIKNGTLQSLKDPGGKLCFSPLSGANHDLLFLSATEPQLHWHHFVETLCRLMASLKVKHVITLGSLYDNVLHTDRIISAVSSDSALLGLLKKSQVTPINYHGPSAIHSLIQKTAPQYGLSCTSLWVHCPHYLQGPPHYGLLSYLGELLSNVWGFPLNTTELDNQWEAISKEIQTLVEENPKLKEAIKQIRKARVSTSMGGQKKTASKDGNVIDLKDFLPSED